MSEIAALYVQTNGVYFGLTDVDPWDEKRNAKKYAGPHSVVAHPPCGPWGRLKFLCTKQDPSCGPRAVKQVRKFGGVLEHPEHSSLWNHCKLPKPNEPTDKWGGFTVAVKQVHYGHRCKKATWLYIVGVDREVAEKIISSKANYKLEPTHRITNGSGGPKLPRVSSREASRTPLAFRDMLISLARHASAP